jgi:putative transposase
MGKRLLKETFISRMRDELLDREVFANLKEAKVLAEDYRDHYNHHRPHGAPGYLPLRSSRPSNLRRHRALSQRRS